MKAGPKMDVEVIPSQGTVDEWRVEAIEWPEGLCYVTLFCGPDAQQRAEEYAAWKYACSPA